MATAPMPRPGSVPPSLPASPRQPSTGHAAVAGSKIPRRRTSTSQSVDLSNANSVETNARVYPTSVPSSPDKRDAGASAHARKPSRTQFLPPPPPPPFTNAAPLIERRRSSASANDGSGTRPRTPSLSIQIPVASSSSSSSSQPQLQARPHVRLPDPHQRHGVMHTLDSTAHRPARRMGHSRNASRESTAAPSSPLKASAGPRASLRRCSAPVHSSIGHDPASEAKVPFPRVPRTPYPFSPPASSSTPLSARSHRPPMLERTLSDSTMATYTSFDLQHPRTPEEEDGEGVRRGGGGECGGSRMRRWLSFWSTTHRGDESDVEAALESSSKQTKPRSQLAAVDETTALLGGTGGDSLTVRQQTRREYVWGEIVCYAKHMLPPIFVFVVVVLVIALLAYRQGIRRIAHPPHD